MKGIRKRPLLARLAADLSISNQEMEEIITLMSSITSEKNSVQPTQSPVDQVSQIHETENVHIANDTICDETSSDNKKNEQNENKQSRAECPGAEHPNQEKNSAEQDVCKTGPSSRFNKYKYEIFEGYAGEDYLRDLAREILPAALYRTWAIAVGFQAPSNACYVGASRIAEKAKRGLRQIQKDRRELELRGLLSRYADWVQVKESDGTWSRKIRVVNDFGGLYDLAYEYHEWKSSAEYVEADRDAADYIRGNAELFEKLLRFDCYRRILICEKPGPKPELNDLHKLYQKHKKHSEQETEQSQNGYQEAKTNYYLPKQMSKRSLYEETRNPQSSIIKRETDSSEGLEERVFGVSQTREPLTIRNTQNNDQAETQKWIRQQPKNEEKPEIQNDVHNTKQSWKEEERSVAPQEQTMPAEAAKHVIEYTVEDIVQNPLAVLTFFQQLSAAKQAKLHKQEQARAAKAQRHQQARAAKRKRRTTPERLTQVITEMMQTLGGNPQYLQSDITRVSKIYWACTQLFPGFHNAWFLKQMEKAFLETTTSKKVNKPVPYFFSTLERNLGLHNDALAYIRSKEVLYCDGDASTFIIELDQRHQKSGSSLDYDQWVKQNYLC